MCDLASYNETDEKYQLDAKTVIYYHKISLDRAILNTVFKNTVRRVNKRLQTGGGHFEHYL